MDLFIVDAQGKATVNSETIQLRRLAIRLYQDLKWEAIEIFEYVTLLRPCEDKKYYV